MNRTSSTNPQNSNTIHAQLVTQQKCKDVSTKSKQKTTNPHRDPKTEQTIKTKSKSNPRTATHTATSSSDRPGSIIINDFFFFQDQHKQKLTKKKN